MSVVKPPRIAHTMIFHTVHGVEEIFMSANHHTVKNELQRRLKMLVARVHEIDDDLSEPGNEDWEERATETENDEVLASMGNYSLGEIEQIKQALHRIEQGNYGVCSRCGVEIPAERLEVLPYATTCTQCAT